MTSPKLSNKKNVLITLCVLLCVYFLKKILQTSFFTLIRCWWQCVMFAAALSRQRFSAVWLLLCKLGLIWGFWFQVGSHSCRQGDSGARGKNWPPSFLLLNVKNPPYPCVIIHKSNWDLFVVSLCYSLIKKMWSHFSSLQFVIGLSVFVEIHVCCILASVSWFGKLLFVEILFCVGAWHDIEGQKK